MADITVRDLRFSFDDPIDFDVSDEELSEMLPLLGLSLALPYLEPYLIRTMKSALKEITDPQVAEDARRFSAQEGHHYRNHAVLNDKLRAKFDDATAEKIRAIESELSEDYRRFSQTESLRFNVAYAEGFEAMTCAGALAAAETGGLGDDRALPGGEVWAWHLAEEIEHRTVAFDVFDHLVGSYFYRIAAGAWSQWHFVGYTKRFVDCMAKGLSRQLVTVKSPQQLAALRRFLLTYSPFYNPAKIALPSGVQELLNHYTTLAESRATTA